MRLTIFTSEHFKNVYAVGELARESTTEDFSVVRMEGSRQVRRKVTSYNIFKGGELDRNAVYAKNAYTASVGKTYQVAFYNLDIVISVDYRVKSVQGTRFRQWAMSALKDYLPQVVAKSAASKKRTPKMQQVAA